VNDIFVRQRALTTTPVSPAVKQPLMAYDGGKQ